MSQSDLPTVYKAMILPMHDYCSTVFNVSLTLTQSGQLERLQAMALKAIYGFDHSYHFLLSISGLTSLKARRDERGDRFVMRCLTNPGFRSINPQIHEETTFLRGSGPEPPGSTAPPGEDWMGRMTDKKWREMYFIHPTNDKWCFSNMIKCDYSLKKELPPPGRLAGARLNVTKKGLRLCQMDRKV